MYLSIFSTDNSNTHRHRDLVEARDVRVGIDGHQHVGHVRVNVVCIEPPVCCSKCWGRRFAVREGGDYDEE